MTHAPALVGLEEGLFADALPGVDITTQVFNAGPAAIEALTAGAIDATYIGPNPSINTFIQSGGESARVIAGATTGGAALVVRDGHRRSRPTSRARRSPPRSWATRRTSRCAPGWPTRASRPPRQVSGDVTITPTENAQTLQLFQDGQIDGAWLPEPWVSRLVIDAGAHVLVDEADLWEDGEFPTTVLLVRADFLDEHPDVVEDLLRGHVAAVEWLEDNPDDAAGVINARDREGDRQAAVRRGHRRARSRTSRSRSTRTPTHSRRSSRTVSPPARRRTVRSTACSISILLNGIL